MQSLKIFPKSQRQVGDFKDFAGGKNMHWIIDWVNKYHNALITAESELYLMGVETPVSKTIIIDEWRIVPKMFVSPNKFTYYEWIERLKKYKQALKAAENQIKIELS